MKKIGLRIFICIAFILSCYPSTTIAWDWSFFKKEEKIDKKEIEYKMGDTVPELVIEEMIAKVATGSKAIMMKKTLYCEARFKNVQSQVINKQGEQELSFGIGQIHLPSHPNVLLEEALDPEFAINFMSKNWEKVKWYAYDRKLDRCN